jgi:hypothetical protein
MRRVRGAAVAVPLQGGLTIRSGLGRQRPGRELTHVVRQHAALALRPLPKEKLHAFLLRGRQGGCILPNACPS